MHQLIISYHARTGSRQAEKLLKNWAEIRLELRQAEREAEEDAVTDMMEFIVKQKNPHMRTEN